MVISESLDKQLKTRIPNLFWVLDIKHKEDKYYIVEFVTIYQRGTNPPQFDHDTRTLDLRVEMRDEKIDNILDFDMTLDDFDVEDVIYTPEQREKLETLRKDKSKKIERREAVNVSKREYSETFHIGQRVWYKNAPGIITFRHHDKTKEQIAKWSVKVNDTEYRYVEGTSLLKREKVDLSYIKIDPELNKLSTEKLLKIFRSKRNRSRGVGNIAIKRILEEREHIQSGETKIVVVK